MKLTKKKLNLILSKRLIVQATANRALFAKYFDKDGDSIGLVISVTDGIGRPQNGVGLSVWSTGEPYLSDNNLSRVSVHTIKRVADGLYLVVYYKKYSYFRRGNYSMVIRAKKKNLSGDFVFNYRYE